MARGKVEWFNEKKGFGFISREDGEKFFVNYSSLKQDGCKGLHEGDEVEFQVTIGEKGERAFDVVRIC
jgi:cold shock protein